MIANQVCVITEYWVGYREKKENTTPLCRLALRPYLMTNFSRFCSDYKSIIATKLHCRATSDTVDTLLTSGCDLAVVGLVRQQRARCAARETQVLRLSPQHGGLQRYTMNQMYQWTLSILTRSFEVRRELFRLASGLIRLVSTSPKRLWPDP
jgi:hypothetical protein